MKSEQSWKRGITNGLGEDREWSRGLTLSLCLTQKERDRERLGVRSETHCSLAGKEFPPFYAVTDRGLLMR